jgi:uncharacterized iron-regulated membrane protein
MRPEICTRPPPISARMTGRGNHLALALLDQQDGHALADVVARDVLEDARAGRIERQVHRGFMRLVVEAGLRVGQAVAGQHHLLLDQQRHPPRST